MFFNTKDVTVSNIEVFKLRREPYRKQAGIRPFQAISFRVYGKAHYEFNGEKMETDAGDILYVPAYAQYIKETVEELFYVVHFQSGVPLGTKLSCLSPKDPNAFREVFERIYRVQKKKSFAYEFECKYLFYQLLTMIEYAWSDNEKRRSFNQIDLAVEMIHENYRNTDFNIEQIAKRLNLSDSYFRRQFLKAVGKRPKEYLLELRLQYACELLRSGYYSVSEVAYRCGFANVYYFSTFIKSRVGVSPSALLPGGGETANKIMDIRNRKIE